MRPVYTIGHSTHEGGSFVALLRDHGITAVADVRSTPYSGRVPHFSQAPLRALLDAAGIAYVFLGRELGGRSEDETCFVGDRVEYERLACTERFQEGLGRVRRGSESHRIALLCAENDPLRCHRAVLVSRHLHGADLRVDHILADGALESHPALERRMLAECKLGDGDLFEPHERRLERAYKSWGERIAWRRPMGDQPAPA